MNQKRKVIAVSGGMDPIHIGHVRMIEQAAEYGDVLVILNSNDWLFRKKGYIFMPFEQRAELLLQIKGVTKVSAVDDSDGTVCEALIRLKPDYFANGGDRKQFNTPEMNICEKHNIEMLWNVGGDDKPQSSSWLIPNSLEQMYNKEILKILPDKFRKFIYITDKFKFLLE